MDTHDAPALGKITGLRIRAIRAPLAKPVKTAAGVIEDSPLVLLDLETNEGVTGRAYLFTFTSTVLRSVASLLTDITPLVVGEALAPAALSKKLQARFRSVGLQGFIGMAISAIDMATWDAKARAAMQPLAECLGGKRVPIPVYYSLGQMPLDETAREVEESLQRGFRAFKVRGGHPDPAVDVEVIKTIRAVAGQKTWIATDFNQTFSVSEAIGRIKALEDVGVDWVEEPTRWENFDGLAFIRNAVSVPIQVGEGWWGLSDMQKSIAAGASSLVMPDLMRIGGVTGWCQAAGLAASHCLPMSSHLFIECSAHVMCVTPTAHMIEFFDVASAINLVKPSISDGALLASADPGSGIEWDEDAIARYQY